MPKLEIVDSIKSIEVESGLVILIENLLVADLLHSIGYFNRHLDVDTIIWNLNSISNKYDYQIVVTDGRMWQQEIEFLDGMDKEPYMTFGILGRWKLSEVMIQQPIRLALVSLTQTFQITECECKWF